MTPTANLAASTSEPTLGRSAVGTPADAKTIFVKTGTQDTSGMVATQPSELRPVAVLQTSHVALEGSNTSGQKSSFVNDISATCDASVNAIRDAQLDRYGVRQSQVGPHTPEPAPAATICPEGVC